MSDKIKYDPSGENWHLSGFNIQDDNWHLSEYDAVHIRSGIVVKKYEDIPNDMLAYIKNEKYPDKDNAYLEILRKGGKGWILEPFKKLQPKSYAVLSQYASDFKLWLYWNTDHWGEVSLHCYGYFEVCGRMVNIEPPAYGGYEFCNILSWVESLSALPEAISKSWLWRANDWAICSNAHPSPQYSDQLITGIFKGLNVELLLNSYKRGNYKKFKDIIFEQIPDTLFQGVSSKYIALSCFLDTRPQGFGGPYGDQLLFHFKHTDQIVYHIHDGDFRHIRVLNNAAEVIDAYCAHTLLRTPGRFDFMPWSVPLK